MNGDTWDDWAAHHAEVFGLTFPAELRMLSAWCQLFIREGWTVAELFAATNWLALHKPPETRRGQLDALGEYVRSRRVRIDNTSKDRPKTADILGTCIDCHGSGWISVPHLRFVENGKWLPCGSPHGLIWYTFAVTCHCSLGNWRCNQLTSYDKPPLTLTVYARSNSDWKEQVEQRAQILKAAVSAESQSSSLDKVLGAVFDRWKTAREKEINDV